jgi:hypothetical protein
MGLHLYHIQYHSTCNFLNLHSAKQTVHISCTRYIYTYIHIYIYTWKQVISELFATTIQLLTLILDIKWNSNIEWNELIITYTCIINPSLLSSIHKYFYYFVPPIKILCNLSVCSYFNLQISCCNI